MSKNPNRDFKGKSGWLEFKTPEELFDYIDKNCVKCEACGHIISKDIANELGVNPITGLDGYICDDCNE